MRKPLQKKGKRPRHDDIRKASVGNVALRKRESFQDCLKATRHTSKGDSESIANKLRGVDSWVGNVQRKGVDGHGRGKTLQFFELGGKGLRKCRSSKTEGWRPPQGWDTGRAAFS